MTRLHLRFENMPERHAELAWRFGEPDACQEDEAGQGSRWVLHAPLPPEAGAAEHLTWAAECLHPHEAFVGELIALGGVVVVRLECAGDGGKTSLLINTRVLLAMAHAGVRLELEVSGT